MGRFTSFILFGVVALLLVVTVVGEHGIVHLQEMEQELSQLDRSNREIQSEMIAINTEIQGLQNNKDHLEKEARQRLGLAKPGEIVYIFSDGE